MSQAYSVSVVPVTSFSVLLMSKKKSPTTTLLLMTMEGKEKFARRKVCVSKETRRARTRVLSSEKDDMAPRHAVALVCAAAVFLSLAPPGAEAQFVDNVTGYVAGADLLTSAQCRVVSFFF